VNRSRRAPSSVSRLFVLVWAIVTTILVHEMLARRFAPSLSYLDLAGLPTPTERERIWVFGWVGFTLMLLMNVYTLRKRVPHFQKLGRRLSDWLGFHILCGLLGPTFILFHAGTEVRGVAALAYWCMVVSVLSGLIGRYIYGQIANRRVDFERRAEHNWNLFATETRKLNDDPELLATIRREALTFAGLARERRNPWMAIFDSMRGDLRLLFRHPVVPPETPDETRELLRRFALAKRRAVYVQPIQTLSSWWHAFHLPFAIFMYACAFVHVASALMLASR